MLMRICWKLGDLQKSIVNSEDVFRHCVCSGVQEKDVETFPKDIVEIGEARIIDGDRGFGIGSWVGWGHPLAWG